MVLFSKRLCETCQKSKAVVLKAGLDIEMRELDALSEPDQAKAMAEAAWLEIYDLAQQELPILIDPVTRERLQGQAVLDHLRELAGARS